MDLKSYLRDGLVHARNVTNVLLDSLQTPADWIHRPDPKCNHALWIAGHLLVAENRFVFLLDSAQAKDLKDLGPLFGRGSQPVDDPDAYPTPEELRNKMIEVREIFLSILDGYSEADFDRETPKEAPEFMPTVGKLYQMAMWHETLHTGQLTIIHRQLGHPPLRG